MARRSNFTTLTLGKTEVTGLKELNQVLETLPEAIQREAQRTGVRNGLEALAEGIRARAPKGDRSSNRYKKKFRREAKSLQRRISVRMASRGSFVVSGVVNVTAPHAHLIEYGHRIVTTTKARPPKGPKRDTYKRTTPQPFVRPGFAAKQDEALDKLIESINEAIDKHW